MTFLIWLALIYLWPRMAQSMHCFFPMNTTRLVAMPRELQCQCDEDHETIELMSHLKSLMDDSMLSSGLSSLQIVDCPQLSLSLQSLPDNFSLTLMNMDELDIVSKWGSMQLEFLNVTQITFKSDFEHTSILVLVLVIMVGVVLSVVITATLILSVWHVCSRSSKDRERSRLSSCLCCRLRRKRVRQVMRVGSWRYESNVNVNPGQQEVLLRQQRGQQHSTRVALQQMLPINLISQPQVMGIARQDEGHYRGEEQGHEVQRENNSNDELVQEHLEHNEESITYESAEVPWDRRVGRLAYADESGERTTASSNSYRSEHNQPTLPRGQVLHQL